MVYVSGEPRRYRLYGIRENRAGPGNRAEPGSNRDLGHSRCAGNNSGAGNSRDHNVHGGGGDSADDDIWTDNIRANSHDANRDSSHSGSREGGGAACSMDDGVADGSDAGENNGDPDGSYREYIRWHGLAGDCARPAPSGKMARWRPNRKFPVFP